MSEKKTRMCGRCGKAGHNRRTCVDVMSSQVEEITQPVVAVKKGCTKDSDCEKYKKVKICNTKTGRCILKDGITAKKELLRRKKTNKENIIEIFSILIRDADVRGEKTAIFKKRQYKRVIEILLSCEEEIDTIEKATKLFQKAGMKNPKKTLNKIKEILETGELSQAKEALKNPRVNVVRELTKIYAIGPANAIALYEKYGIVYLNDLKKAVKKDPTILNSKQALGLKYHDDLELRIPRAEIDYFNTICKKIVKQMNKEEGGGFEMSINGSYRRGTKTSGDIDLMIKTKPKWANAEHKGKALMRMVEELTKLGIVVATLAKGKKKFMGIIDCLVTKGGEKILGIKRHLDIIETTPAEWPFAKLYFTGSGGFNVKMRRHVIGKGYSMNEYSLTHKKSKEKISEEEIMKKIGKPIFETERDIFQFLDYPYVEPNKRIGITLSKII